MNELYYYRPLASFSGKVFKCAGICDASNADMANELYIEKRDPVYLPGFAVVDGYKGDKITIDRSNVATEYIPGGRIPPVTDFIAKVEIKSVFGNELIYPANFEAGRFAAIAGKKTLSRTDLANIKALGFAVEEVTTRKLAA